MIIILFMYLVEILQYFMGSLLLAACGYPDIQQSPKKSSFICIRFPICPRERQGIGSNRKMQPSDWIRGLSVTALCQYTSSVTY